MEDDPTSTEEEEEANAFMSRKEKEGKEEEEPSFFHVLGTFDEKDLFKTCSGRFFGESTVCSRKSWIF